MRELWVNNHQELVQGLALEDLLKDRNLYSIILLYMSIIRKIHFMFIIFIFIYSFIIAFFIAFVLLLILGH